MDEKHSQEQARSTYELSIVDIARTTDDVAATERKPRQYRWNRLDEKNAAGAGAASNAGTVADTSMIALDNESHVGDHVMPTFGPPVWNSSNQRFQGSLVQEPIEFMNGHIHEHPHSTHLDPSLPHPLPGAHSSGTLHTVFDETPDAYSTSGAGASFAIADYPLRRRRDSSSIPSARPLGPRKPLRSHAQVYGEHNEGDSTGLESVPQNTSSLHSGEAADLGEGRRRREVIVVAPHTQNENFTATGEDGATNREGQECVRREEERGELQSVDRCSRVTPPPPYRER